MFLVWYQSTGLVPVKNKMLIGRLELAIKYWTMKYSHNFREQNVHSLKTIFSPFGKMSLLVVFRAHITGHKHRFGVTSARSWQLVPIIAMFNGRQDMMLKNMVAKLRFKAMTKTNNWRCCTKSLRSPRITPTSPCLRLSASS